MSDDYGFRFRDWDVYKDTRAFRKKIYALLQKYPQEEKFALCDQTKRALNSVLLNTAESANRNTDKDRRAYINRAHCSLDETVACLDAARDNEYISQEEHADALKDAESLAKRLRGFTVHLSASSS